MLLLRLHRLALRLRALQPLCLVFLATGLGMGLHAFLSERALPAAYLNLAILLALWSLMLFAFIQLFQRIPAPVLPKDSFLERLLSRVRLAAYHLLAFAVVLTGALLISISAKLIATA